MGASLFPASGAGSSNLPSSSAAVTVNIALSGAAGVDVGAVAANKLYSVFAIGDSRGFNAGSAVISLAVPTTFGPHFLPLGYDSWRYIGSGANQQFKQRYNFQTKRWPESSFNVV